MMVVLSDFDGTIVQIDTAAYVLEQFAEGDWRQFDEKLVTGEIGLEECIRRQFSLVKAPEKEILDKVILVTDFRPNFEALVGYCRTNNVPFVAVTGGLDFIVRYFLRPWRRVVRIIAPEAKCSSRGIEFKNFPKLHNRASHNFKDDLVRNHRKRGKKAVYIGDSLNDYEAVRNADFGFAVRHSELALKCKIDGIECNEIENFREVIEKLRAWE